LRPLPKIPNCCLPQESGPSLSPRLAGHPLRPATDRRPGGPSPHQLANRPRAPPPARKSVFPVGLIRRAYAVLAPLSEGYPPPVGRSPTCYSAVRHCHPKVAVRLACFRHAASVDPEPGSNSPSLILADARHPRLPQGAAPSPATSTCLPLRVPHPTTLRLLRCPPRRTRRCRRAAPRHGLLVYPSIPIRGNLAHGQDARPALPRARHRACAAAETVARPRAAGRPDRPLHYTQAPLSGANPAKAAFE
jgi:hypothetical protein